MTNRVLLSEARWGLAKLWFIWGFLIFTIIVLQSIFDKYNGQVKEAWSWFIPTILPTLALMIGVLGAAALLNQDDIRTVNRNFFDMTWWVSVGYLIILSVTILLQPFAPVGPIELYMLSNYWLGPIQGIVGGCIGLLFTSQQQEQPSSVASPKHEQPGSTHIPSAG